MRCGFLTHEKYIILSLSSSKQATIVSPKLIPLANPFQRPACGRQREQAEADQMEERSSSFFALQFELNGMSLLDHLSKMERLLSADIADV